MPSANFSAAWACSAVGTRADARGSKPFWQAVGAGVPGSYRQRDIRKHRSA
jgi:hypothetical protein